ncbi:hypothetical protein OWV82_022529 [Melia azedarach]|uniref:Uncharacterized protein n=1 Tax=Melia azedarach TaxID=155640 RepID=A0ACC1WUB5_MELAZ|nr:hypothetical protein OWV82_022529 [Melia azedarach]
MFKYFGSSSSSSSSSSPSVSSREEANAQSILSRGKDRSARVQERDSASQESTTRGQSQSYDAKGVLYNREESRSSGRVHNTDQQMPPPQDMFQRRNYSG